MRWSNIWLIFRREVRDQLRDRRTLFTIAILPLLLYPLIGTCFVQVSQFMKAHPTNVKIIGAESLPQDPRLLVDGSFSEEFCAKSESELLVLSLEEQGDDKLSPADMLKVAQEEISRGEYGAIVYFPPNFGARLREFRETVLKSQAGNATTADERDKLRIMVPQPIIYSNLAQDDSRIANDRVSRVLQNWRDAIVEGHMRASTIPAALTTPFKLEATDVSDSGSRRAAIWSKVLPFIVLIWALTGAFYPAVDLCAGEKERGTLETLLCSPAERGEIVWGKLLTIMLFSAATSLLNLVSMGVTGTFIINQMAAMGSNLAIGPPPLSAIFWLMLALVPIAALFSALALAIAAFARSTKEGQYYLMPLLLICLPLIILPILPTAKLDLGTSLIPITGLMLLLRSCIEGQYLDALRFLIPVVATTSICCLLAIRWAIDQFNNENVLFRESERWSLGLWLRRVFSERGDTPTIGVAVLCGIVLLAIRFFANFLVQAPASWNDIAMSAAFTQIALIAFPGILMAIMLTRNPRRSLGLVGTKWSTLPIVVGLAICLQPAITYLTIGISQMYPISPEQHASLQQFQEMFTSAPLWSLLLVLAVLPAICEELVFRGFMLSGLRHMGHKWIAIIVTSAFFGVLHGVLQQSINACIVGVLIGYIAVQTGSVIPCIFFHLTHNSLAMLNTRIDSAVLERFPILSFIYEPIEGGVVYSVPIAIVGAVAAIFIIAWLRKLPYQPYEEEQLNKALDHQSLHAC